MKLYLTGEPCSQQRHCYYVQGRDTSFIMDCGYQRCYRGDELPHLTPEQIRSSRYLFLTHSHENQSGALPYLLSNGFTGRVVLTTETARQLPLAIDRFPAGCPSCGGAAGIAPEARGTASRKTGDPSFSPAIIMTVRVCMPATPLKG